MKRYLYRLTGLSVIIVGLLLWNPCLGVGATSESGHAGQKWLSIGKVGPKAIDLKIWADEPTAGKFKSGDPIVIHMKCAQKAYVTAVYISSRGDAVVLFPNRETPDNLVEAGKEYTLFGPASGIKLKFSRKTKRAKIVFYASVKPFKLDPLKIAKGEAFLAIPHSSTKELRILTKKIEDFAKDDTFTRKVLALKRAGKGKGSINLMGLPMRIRSSRPESIAGVQGLKKRIPGSERQ